MEPHDFLARLARDEFAVGVPEMIQHNRANELGTRLLSSLAEFVSTRGLQMQIGVNIGIAIYPRDAQTSEALMQAARVSLSEARESGSNQVRVFNSAAGERARACGSSVATSGWPSRTTVSRCSTSRSSTCASAP
ncbi:diguanylate cyclase domain-containing protein [Cupriavidus basilensis]